MRITSDTLYRQIADSIGKASERLYELQRQVSTGKRIGRLSDDPAAAAAAAVERGRLAATDQYSAAANSAGSRLMVTDTVLSDLVQQLSSAQVTVLAARGTTATTPAQREAKAQELEVLRDAVMQDLNTSFRGTYIFAGAASTTRPYSQDNAGVVSGYQGSTTEVGVDIDNGLEVTVGINGEAIAQGADSDDVFTVFERAIAAARSGDTAALNTAAADLKRAFDRATAAQSRVGSSLRAIEDGKLRLGQAALSSEAELVALEDVNMASAITSMTQADTVYRAALAAASQMQRLSLMDYLR